MRTLWGLFSLLSPDRASAAGRVLMRTLGPRLHKHRIIKRNLAIAFPEKSPDDVELLARDVWGHVGAVLAEYPHLGTICGREAGKRLEIQVSERARVFRGQATRAVFVGAHLSNWEVGAAMVHRLGVSNKAVYTPVQNPWINRALFGFRQSLGYGLINRDEAMRAVIRQLSSGGSVGLLVDQRVDSGEPVEFFGHDMLTSVTPARLALRFRCELIPVRVERLSGARFRVIFCDPILPDDPDADEPVQVLQMTRKINAFFEDWIRARPDEWMCSKRRWPKTVGPRQPE